jgi:hypothetical protein
MRSPIAPQPGRPRVIDQLWKTLNQFRKSIIQGYKRPIAHFYSPVSLDRELDSDRNYDQEIYGWVIRDPERNIPVVEMVERSPEVRLCLGRIQDALWGSHEGENGFTVSDTLDDEETPIDPEVYEILMNVQEVLVGRSRLKPVTREMIAYGDCFMSVSINPRTSQIEAITELPTFEMFRVEDRQGRLLGFQQRWSTSDTRNAVSFHPLTCIHWRYARQWGNIYGTPMFSAALNDWHRLCQADEDLAKGANAVGVNPLIHQLPDVYTDEEVAAYKRAIEEQQARGVVNAYYPPADVIIQPAYSTTPNIDGLIQYFKLRSDRILDQSSVPSYLSGREISGAKEIGEQPAMAFARLINSIRNDFTGLGQPGYDSGLRHLFNLALALADIPKEKWLYRIIFPPAYVSVYQSTNGLSVEADKKGIDDISAINYKSNHQVNANPNHWVGCYLPENLTDLDSPDWGSVPKQVRERLVESLAKP